MQDLIGGPSPSKPCCTGQAAGNNFRTRCRALGCTIDLDCERRYCQRKKLCHAHMKAEAVQLPDSEQLFRYCFQCGKLESIERFDDNKRTCRLRLMRRQLLPSNHKKRSSSSSSSGCSTTSKGPGKRSSRPHSALLPRCASAPTLALSDSMDFEQAALQVAGNAAAEQQQRLLLQASGQTELMCAWEEALQQLSHEELGRAPALAAPAPAAPTAPGLLLAGAGLSAADTQVLELMLESELAVAALGAVIASHKAYPMDSQSAHVSAQLADEIVAGSGLFAEQPLAGLLCNQYSFTGSTHSAHSLARTSSNTEGMPASPAGPAPSVATSFGSCGQQQQQLQQQLQQRPPLPFQAPTQAPDGPAGKCSQPYGQVALPCTLTFAPAFAPAVAGAADVWGRRGDDGRLYEMQVQLQELQSAVECLKQQLGM